MNVPVSLLLVQSCHDDLQGLAVWVKLLQKACSFHLLLQLLPLLLILMQLICKLFALPQ